ncbi:DUF4344 domain-containing metallopeptidase, partial [Mycobacteroides abscessus]|uniref:DUF4344 domain-containing metallopeptidase n=1 Tax=Mycobacteroides abscessus TaxID=36809 RepID=UPI000926316C|nr:DUF4344 domain-containing metallopeptidase [Mycobacteroides abscessus]SHS51977.1 Uncharacterised protein [Mycobacteroides abscessus subsp. abscessus]
MRLLSLSAAISVFAVVTAGCGSSDEPAAGKSAATDLPAATTTVVQEDNGRMIARYEDASTPEAVKGRALLQSTNLLEDLAQSVNDSFKLPFDVPLIGSECGEANDYWSPTDKALTMCYEDVDESLRIFRSAADPDPESVARRIAIASFYHELGHMAIDLYDLPATGREEDVADQMSAYVLLDPDENGAADPDNVQAAKDIARAYKVQSQEGGPPDEAALSDVHTLNEARMYNFECWIYGSNPEGNKDIVADGLLPQDRADGCEDEYRKLANAWSTLLSPYLKD